MKRYLVIHRGDSVGDIPQDALRSTLFCLADTLFRNALTTIIQAAPEPLYRDAIAELMDLYFNKYNGTDSLTIELDNDPTQRPIAVNGEGTSIGNAVSTILNTMQRPPRVVSVPSSTRNINHFVSFNENDQPTSCTCEAFTYRGECKHLEQAKQRL